MEHQVCPHPRGKEGCLEAVLLTATLPSTLPVWLPPRVASLGPCPALQALGIMVLMLQAKRLKPQEAG